MPVPVFCCFCIPEKLVRKYSRNWTKLHGGSYFIRTHLKDQRSNEEEPGGPHTHLGRGSPPARPRVVWAPRGSSAAALSPTYSPRRENPKGLSKYPRKVPETPPPSTLAREGPEHLPGTLPERGIVTGGFYIAMPASGVMRV